MRSVIYRRVRTCAVIISTSIIKLIIGVAIALGIASNDDIEFEPLLVHDLNHDVRTACENTVFIWSTDRKFGVEKSFYIHIDFELRAKSVRTWLGETNDYLWKSLRLCSEIVALMSRNTLR